MLVGSWITALYILPALAVWFAKKKKEDDKQPGENWLTKTYGVIIGKSLSLSLLVIVAAYVLVAISGTLFGSVKKEMFPLSARNQFLIYQDMPKGTAISATEAEALAVQKWLSDKEAIENRRAPWKGALSGHRSSGFYHR